MKETAAKLKSFFQGFDLPAYSRDNIPDTVEIPYITFDLIEPRWDTQGNMTAQVYYPKGWIEELLTKADEICAAIGEGLEITMSSGYLMLYLATPQQQRMSDKETESILISLLINSYHLPGV